MWDAECGFFNLRGFVQTSASQLASRRLIVVTSNLFFLSSLLSLFLHILPVSVCMVGRHDDGNQKQIGRCKTDTASAPWNKLSSPGNAVHRAMITTSVSVPFLERLFKTHQRSSVSKKLSDGSISKYWAQKIAFCFRQNVLLFRNAKGYSKSRNLNIFVLLLRTCTYRRTNGCNA